MERPIEPETTRLLLPLALACFAFASPAFAEFAPGRIYVTGIAGNCEFDPTVPHDSIFEFDPLTGETKFFSMVPPGQCGMMSGLAFSPAGDALRASVYYTRSVLEFAGDGSATVALDFHDGFLGGPRGSNNVGYAADGDFFASYSGEILRFDDGNGPGEVIADYNDGVTGYGPIAVTPAGDLFFGVAESPHPTILHVSGSGTVTEFDSINTDAGLTSLALDTDGNLFVLLTDGLYRYDAGQPDSFRRLAELDGAGPDASIAMAPGGEVVYVCVDSVFRAVDPMSGQVSELGTFTSPDGYVLGSGMAVAIPEPAGAVVALALAAAVRRRNRS